MNQSKNAFLLLLLSAVCLVFAFWIFYDFFIVNSKPENVASAEMISEYTASNLIDSALKAEIIIPKADLVSEVNSPFRPLDFRPARSAPRAVANPPTVPQRIPLKLRGLMRNPPLVIVEDASGQTHIKAQGGNVRGALIVSIGSNSAVFRDSSGTYELTVEESR